MAFVINKQEKIQVKIKNFNDFYRDAINKEIPIYPFDIYAYVDTFDNIEIIDDDLSSEISGIIEYIDGGFIIAVNKYHSYERRKEILAILFFHYILHKDYILQNRKIQINILYTADKMNLSALNFASKLLIPKATFITIARECKTFGELAEKFQVTPKMAKIRFNNVYVKKN